jgi:TetR/AcrR family transcriptional regulator, cholesterol catabolism regulator
MTVASEDGPKGAQRRKEIIQAAVVVFASQGYGGASLSDIAKAAGTRKGNLYYYYPAKEELLAEIVDDLHNKFNDSMAVWSSTGSTPSKRLESVFFGHIILVCKSYLQVRVTYENFRILTDTRRHSVLQKRHLYESQMASLISDQMATQKPGIRPTDVRIETRAILGMLNWVYEWYSPQGRASEIEIATTISRLALRSIG